MSKLFFIVASLFFLGCTDGVESGSDNNLKPPHAHNEKTYFTCAMHPKVKLKQPGKCPICHMNLTKVTVKKTDALAVNNGETQKFKWQCKEFPDVSSESAAVCPLDGSQMVKVQIKEPVGRIVGRVVLRDVQLNHFRPDYFEVTKMKMNKNIRLLGSVIPSEEKESSIPARVGGRIERVYVKSTGSFIRKGDPVVDIYSPKLIAAGEEFLIAKQSYEKNKTKEFLSLFKQSMQRLKLWGVKAKQLNHWYDSKKIPKIITIYSQATGVVRKRYASVGKYFKEGQNFFELSNLSEVWIEMDVYEHDSSLAALNQKVTLEFSALPGTEVIGRVDFVSPILDKNSRTLKIRTTVDNESGKLKPGMIADAMLELKLEGESLVVPRSSVIDTGVRKIVWIKKTNKSFQAKTVLVVHESEGYLEVKKGLVKGDLVVVDGNFLLDAQAQLFGGYVKDKKK